jgi:hypothetical protein
MTSMSPKLVTFGDACTHVTRLLICDFGFAIEAQIGFNYLFDKTLCPASPQGNQKSQIENRK